MIGESKYVDLDIAQRFVELASSVASISDLSNLLEAVCLEIGFTYFALVRHADLRELSPKIIRLYNYPSTWVEYFITNALFAEDPVHLASLLSNVGFAWEELPSKIHITSRQRNILEMAAKHGLRKGYTVPANIPGESTGSCSFATKDGADLPQGSLLLAELIGNFAFEAARRLGRTESMPSPAFPRLTQRQHDCLLLAIHGKTDWEIGTILGLSEETVTEYLDLARKRYGVTKRLPLAVRAIYDGQINFIEAVAAKPPLKGG
jgi:LuxR family quorum-sensing system transcriptional regulator CciR